MILAVLTVAAEGASSVEGAALRTLISAGPVGVFLLMVLFRFKVQPTYVHEDAKTEWERERARLERECAESKAVNIETQKVYVDVVIPTLTRVHDELRTVKERNGG